MICTDVAARGIDVSGLPYGKNIEKSIFYLLLQCIVQSAWLFDWFMIYKIFLEYDQQSLKRRQQKAINSSLLKFVYLMILWFWLGVYLSYNFYLCFDVTNQSLWSNFKFWSALGTCNIFVTYDWLVYFLRRNCKALW